MKPADFSVHLTSFLTHYLAAQRNLSPNTIKAYRDVFTLLLRFCRDACGIAPERLRLEQIDAPLVEAFLDHLEKERGSGLSTRNHRLAALHAFFRYLQAEQPERLLQCQKILAIPQRRHPRAVVGYLSKEELTRVLAQPELNTTQGRTDAVLLSVLYDTGARVQEFRTCFVTPRACISCRAEFPWKQSGTSWVMSIRRRLKSTRGRILR
jgi:integrase/recombinase XerD